MNIPVYSPCMKTSEVIRNAVDKHLWCATMPRSADRPLPYLCIAISTYCGNDSRAKMLESIINEELAQYRKDYSTGLPDMRMLPIGGTLNWQWDGEELQAFRFMYAEMLACYFESIGD